MNRPTYHTGHLTLAIVAALLLLVAACGATATPTVPPATPTHAATPLAATATLVQSAPTTTTTKAAPTIAAAVPSATTAVAAATITQPTLAPAATIAPVAGTVSFAQSILPLFVANCTRCHGGATPRSGMSLESYQNAIKGGVGGPDIIPSDPEKSLLYTYVRDGVMPLGGTALSAADVKKIFDWIKAGAPNN